MPTRARVQSLIDHVLQGKILPAMEEFYADSATMQENLNPPTVGKAANIEREKQFIGYIKQFHGATGDIVAIDGDNVVIHWTMDFDAVDGKRIRTDQLAWQTWHGDHIVRERFVHDSGAAA